MSAKKTKAEKLESRREWYKKNKETIKKKVREYQVNKSVYYKIYKRHYYDKNTDKLKKYAKDWLSSKPEKY